MFDSISVVGRGRVGSAIAARLHERGVAIRDDRVDLVLLCVPDAAIRDVARAIDPGPWIAHVSGATPLAALDPHVRRFSVHPLQTFTRARGAEQLDGAWAAVTAETDAARARGALAGGRCLSLRPFDLAGRACGPCTTPAPRSPPTTSSPSTARRHDCSKQPGRRPRRCCR